MQPDKRVDPNQFWESQTDDLIIKIAELIESANGVDPELEKALTIGLLRAYDPDASINEIVDLVFNDRLP